MMSLSLKSEVFSLPEYRYPTLLRPIVEWKEGGPWYGYEAYGETDPSLVWALSKYEVVKRAEKQKPLAIDFGGASGYQAMNLARKGFDVVIVDIVGEEEIISKRNRVLSGENKKNGKISLFVSDIRDVNAPLLSELCGNKKPSVVVALKLIHFLHPPEVAKLIEVVSLFVQPKAFLALSYQKIVSEKNFCEFINHDHEKVAQLADAYGFKKKFEKQEITYPDVSITTWHTMQGFRLSRPAKEPSP
jgi:hypothetical protein